MRCHKQTVHGRFKNSLVLHCPVFSKHTKKPNEAVSLRPQPMDHLAWLNSSSLPTLFQGWEDGFRNRGEQRRGASVTLRLWYTNVWNKPWILILGAEGHTSLTRQLSVQYPNEPSPSISSARGWLGYSIWESLVEGRQGPDTSQRGAVPDCAALMRINI